MKRTVFVLLLAGLVSGSVFAEQLSKIAVVDVGLANDDGRVQVMGEAAQLPDLLSLERHVCLLLAGRARGS